MSKLNTLKQFVTEWVACQVSHAVLDSSFLHGKQIS